MQVLPVMDRLLLDCQMRCLDAYAGLCHCLGHDRALNLEGCIQSSQRAYDRSAVRRSGC